MSTFDTNRRNQGVRASLSSVLKPPRVIQPQRVVHFTDRNKERRPFPFYTDEELQIPRSVSVLVHKSTHDDDLDTDNEQLERSINYCFNDLIHGIKVEFGEDAVERFRQNDLKTKSKGSGDPLRPNSPMFTRLRDDPGYGDSHQVLHSKLFPVEAGISEASEEPEESSFD
jgi:hypothetical protein